MLPQTLCIPTTVQISIVIRNTRRESYDSFAVRRR